MLKAWLLLFSFYEINTVYNGEEVLKLIFLLLLLLINVAIFFGILWFGLEYEKINKK